MTFAEWMKLPGLIGALIKPVKYILSRFRLRQLKYILPINNSNRTNEIFVNANVNLAYSGDGRKTVRGTLQYCTALSIDTIQKRARDIPVSLTINPADRPCPPSANVIWLGLSRKQDGLTQQLIDQIHKNSGIEIVKPDSAHGYFLYKGKKYECTDEKNLDKQYIVKQDHGLIYRVVHSNGNSMLLCGGIHGFGTLAAVHVALSPKFANLVIRHRAHGYAQLVRVDVHPKCLSIDDPIWDESMFSPFDTHR